MKEVSEQEWEALKRQAAHHLEAALAARVSAARAAAAASATAEGESGRAGEAPTN